jgi:outer membrane protein OmpA-like peptidoglycan-associated protein
MDEDAKKDQQAALNVYGYYARGNLYAGRYDHPDLSQHGFGVINNASEVLSNATGKLNYKFNVALVAEGGFLISLSRRVDIPIGAYIDYGLMNLVRGNGNEDRSLFTGPGSDYVAGAENNVGKGIVYNSITNSSYVKKVKTLSYGGKIGIRVKLGKLSKKDDPEQLATAPIAPERDTILVPVYDRSLIDSLAGEIFKKLQDIQQPEDAPADPLIDDTYVRKYKYNTDPLEYDYIYDKNLFSEEEISILLEPIYFDLNKDLLRDNSILILNKKIRILNNHPDIKLVIFGNTCDIGRDEYNYTLGERRAEAARKYLVSKGIANERLITRTLSRFEPELPNTDEFNRSHNRRDDFRPLFPKKRMMMW